MKPTREEREEAVLEWPEIPKEGTKAREDRDKGEVNFYWFCTDILGHDRKRLMGEDAGDDAVNLYEDLHGKMCHFLAEVESTKETYSCVLIPREHFKTTIVLSYVIWRMVRNSDLRILIVHGIEEHAKKFMREVKWHLEHNERLRDAWCDVIWERPRGDAPVWGTLELILRRKVNDKVPTLSVTSVGSALAGLHYHLQIHDDIMHEGNYQSPTERANVKEFRGNADHLLRKNGKIINVGTRWHFDDAHGELVDGYGFDLPAPAGKFVGQVRLFHRSAYDEKGEPIFPTHWSKERLQAKRDRTTPKMWSCQFMNRPQSEEDALFQEGLFNWFDLTEEGKVPTHRALRFFTAVDPNRSEKTQHDPCVVMTGARDSEGHIWVVDITRGHPTLSEMVEWIRGHVRRWKSGTVIVETNNYQLQICSELRRDQLRSNVLYNIQEANRGPDSKKYARYVPVSLVVNAGGFHIRRGLDQCALEMKNYPSSKNDDCLDALADIWRYGSNAIENDARVEPPTSPYLGRKILEQLKHRAETDRVSRRRF